MRRFSLLALSIAAALVAFALFDSSIGVAAKTLTAAAFFAVAAIVFAVLDRRDPSS